MFILLFGFVCASSSMGKISRNEEIWVKLWIEEEGQQKQCQMRALRFKQKKKRKGWKSKMRTVANYNAQNIISIHNHSGI